MAPRSFGGPGHHVRALRAGYSGHRRRQSNAVIRKQRREPCLGERFDGGACATGGQAPLSSCGDLAEQAPMAYRSRNAVDIDLEGGGDTSICCI